MPTQKSQIMILLLNNVMIHIIIIKNLTEKGVAVMLEQAMIKELINFHNHSFTIIDKDENVIYWSDRAAEIFNMDKDFVIGKKITAVFSEDNLVMLKSLRENIVIEKKQHMAAENIYVNIKSIPILIDG